MSSHTALCSPTNFIFLPSLLSLDGWRNWKMKNIFSLLDFVGPLFVRHTNPNRILLKLCSTYYIKPAKLYLEKEDESLKLFSLETFIDTYVYKAHTSIYIVCCMKSRVRDCFPIYPCLVPRTVQSLLFGWEFKRMCVYAVVHPPTQLTCIWCVIYYDLIIYHDNVSLERKYYKSLF